MGRQVTALPKPARSLAAKAATALAAWYLLAPPSSLAGAAQAPPTTTHWPKVVQEAMAYVRPRAHVPLEAPRWLPSAGGVPNSAQAYAGQYYGVALYRCPAPLPVNSPGVGTGRCGAMASYYGYFQGHRYPTARTAVSALPNASASLAGCTRTARATLSPGVVAEVHSGGTGGGDCAVTWSHRGWQFQLTGDLGNGQGSGRAAPWHQVAASILGYLAHHALPPGPGVLQCDMAGDGLHTGLYWVEGSDLYVASAYHSALAAISLAEAMAPYPG